MKRNLIAYSRKLGGIAVAKELWDEDSNPRERCGYV